MELTVETRSVPPFEVLEIGGEIDVYTAPRLREAVVEAIEAGKLRLIVDVQRVDFLDSTGLGVLVGALKRVRADDGTLDIVCAGPRRRRHPRHRLHARAAAQDLPDHGTRQGVRPARQRRGRRRRPRVSRLSLPLDVTDRLATIEYRTAINDYLTAEVHPYVPDAWVDHDKSKIGYEIPLTRHFYKYTPPRPLADIDAEIKQLETQIQELLGQVAE